MRGSPSSSGTKQRYSIRLGPLPTFLTSCRDGTAEHLGQGKACRQRQQIPKSLSPPLLELSSLSFLFLPHGDISHASPSLWIHLILQSLSSPIFSNLVDVDDVISLSYGNFSRIWRKSHALYHIALPAVLKTKRKREIMNRYERKKKKRGTIKRDLY